MEKLLRIAKKNKILVEYMKLPENGSVSTPEIGTGAIIMDESLRGADERVHMAHELGHCIRGAFYNVYSPLDVRARHEERANRWAAHKLLPPAKIKKAMLSGLTEAWQLAEQFDVTEDFIRTALRIYQCEEVLS